MIINLTITSTGTSRSATGKIIQPKSPPPQQKKEEEKYSKNTQTPSLTARTMFINSPPYWRRQYARIAFVEQLR